MEETHVMEEHQICHLKDKKERIMKEGSEFQLLFIHLDMLKTQGMSWSYI